jgi:hypothetical protein
LFIRSFLTIITEIGFFGKRLVSEIWILRERLMPSSGEGRVDIVGVTGSIPGAPTNLKALETLDISASGAFAFLVRKCAAAVWRQS